VLRADSRENTKSEFNEYYVRSRLANLERMKYREEIQLNFSGLTDFCILFLLAYKRNKSEGENKFRYVRLHISVPDLGIINGETR